MTAGDNVELKKNDEVKLNIENMTSEGSAVGHYNGMAVFVRGAVPGDVIIAHIIKVSKRYAVATLKKIVTASPCRIESDCPVSKKCGGCSFRNMTYEEELKFKLSRVNDALKRIGHLDIEAQEIIGAEKTEHYRNKAQYPVSICDGELFAGFYAYKSHRIIPCRGCKLQSEDFDLCLDAFAEWIEKSNISSYDENTGKGYLRHIYLRKAFATGEIMACAVVNGKELINEKTLIEALCKIENVKSICFNINTDKSNVILSDNTKIVWGSDTVTDVLLGKKFVISPNSFYQVNHDQCEKLYTKAIEFAQPNGGETVIDLYCGAGTIGLSMADRVKTVFGIEIVQSAVENAKRNAKINNITNAEFFCGDAYEGAKELEKRKIKADIIVLDPPRKGCQRELIDLIAKMKPEKIVYVSCDSATLARDLAILEEKNYKTQKVCAVDMFPRTPHVETVCLMSKKDK